MLNIPVSFAQTELRRGKFMQIAQMPLALGQLLQMRSLTLHVISNLTPGVLPVYSTSSLGTISVGLYFGSTITSPLALASVPTAGFSSINPYALVKCVSPGVYIVIVSNNTTNMDFSVCVTGSAKLYL